MAKWKRHTYTDGTSYSTKTPSGEIVYIDRSMDRKGWTSGGQYYEHLADAKADIIQRIDAGEGFYFAGGLATKNYVNPVTITDNRKKKK